MNGQFIWTNFHTSIHFFLHQWKIRTITFLTHMVIKNPSIMEDALQIFCLTRTSAKQLPILYVYKLLCTHVVLRGDIWLGHVSGIRAMEHEWFNMQRVCWHRCSATLPFWYWPPPHVINQVGNSLWGNNNEDDT
jgi:hypothetical protein